MALHISRVAPRQKVTRKEEEKKNVAAVALKILWKLHFFSSSSSSVSPAGFV
jgi:hypothetical protein